MKKLALLAWAFLASATALGNVGVQFQLESEFQRRIESVVRRFDPTATVRIQVRLQDQEYELPMVGETVRGVFAQNLELLDLADVEAVEIFLSLRELPLPAAIEQQVREATGPFVKAAKVHTDRYEQSQFKPFSDAETKQRMADELGALRDQVRWALGLVGAVILIIALVFGWMGARARRGFMDLGERLIRQITEGAMGGGGMRSSAPAMDFNQARAMAPQTGASSSGHERITLRELTPEAVVALLSDCYWTEADAEAAWIWSHLTPEMKLKLCAAWPVASSYAKYLGGIAPVLTSAYQDPIYLEPLALQWTSQADVLAWVREDFSRWKHISRMRQDALDISLEERVVWESQELPEGARSVGALPGKSAPRKLRARIQLATMNDRDEQALWENPELLPAPDRSQVASLAWLAHSPLERRRQLLSGLSAQELAGLTSRVPAIQAAIDEAVPEKKRALAAAYREQGVAARPELILALNRELFRQAA